MARELTKQQLAERSLIKKYRKELWNPFIACIKRYQLVNDGDRIAVAVDGTLPSMLTAKLLQQLQRVSETVFSPEIILLAPPFDSAAEANRQLLNLSGTVVTAEAASSPEALLAQCGCNKLAYGACRTDTVETVLVSMLFRGTVEAFLPKVTLADGGEIIYPLYCTERSAMADWARYNGLHFSDAPKTRERAAAEALLADLKKSNPDVERNVFQSLHAVCRDTLPGYVQDGESHRFSERFDRLSEGDEK